MTRRADVIVIGAGAAGLRAAQDLTELGRDVVVLEAKDRVGGRVKPGVVGGRIVDKGGQWVGATHSVLLDQAARLGVTTYRQYEKGKGVAVLAGRLSAFDVLPKMSPLALLELAWLQKRWDRDMREVPAEAPWQAPKAEEWDAMTLESWIVRNLRTREARAFARIVPRGAWAAEARQVSYLWFMDALRSGGGLTQLSEIEGGALQDKFNGGMHGVVAGMARGLGDRVVLDAAVTRVRQDDDGVTVETVGKGVFTAPYLIVAAPPGPIARIAFEPLLPGLRDGLQQRMPMGNIIKFFVAYETPFWRELGYSGQVVTEDEAVGVLMDDVQDVGPPMLIGFFEGSWALKLSGADKAARREIAVASLVRFFGERAANPIDYDDNDWTLEPWTHGYVGTMPPGVMTRYGPALREPCGRIHWAGTETADEYAGYIEGAMRSGIRAAAEVASRHNQ